MRVTVTGATGLIGARLVRALADRGDKVTVLSRRAEAEVDGARVVQWAEPTGEAAPAAALDDRDAVVHLAGEPVAQRWSAAVKQRIRESREAGTRNLVAGMRAAATPPRALVSASGVGYYGPRGDERLDEESAPGDDFLAGVCVAWEREAQAADARVVNVRTGVVLAAEGGALAKMLPFFKLGIGGPVAGGRQYMPWIHVDDLIGMYLAALDGENWSGPVNATAPEPVTNREFSRTLGRVLRRPAFAPVPKLAIRTLYGEMANIVAEGQRAVPRRPLELGYAFRHTELEPALRSALS